MNGGTSFYSPQTKGKGPVLKGPLMVCDKDEKDALFPFTGLDHI